MQCIWEEVGNRGPNGLGSLRCKRHGCHSFIRVTPHRAHEVKGFTICTGEPLPGEDIKDFVGVDGLQFSQSSQLILPAGTQMAKPTNAGLTEKEVKDLFKDEDDTTLIGNRIAAMTKAIGLPPCGACNLRKEWMNQAHRWLRRFAGTSL